MTASRLGPLTLVEELGRGGMGTVHRAVVTTAAFGLAPGAEVAVKVLHPHLLHEGDYAERFAREAEIGLRVRDDRVVRTYATGRAREGDGPEVPYLVLEYVRGQTLRALAGELGRLPEALVRHVGQEIAAGLAAIHRTGAVHRDVKPENVLVTPENAVKLMDLGVAKREDDVRRLSQSGAFVGSVLYAAPEQFAGREEVALDGRADLYALGLVLFELTVGRHPFGDADVRKTLARQLEAPAPRTCAFRPETTPFLDAVIARLLEREPGDRFARAEDVAQVLEVGERSAWWEAELRERPTFGPRRVPRLEVARDAAIHGREAELASLDAAFEAARKGDGRVVLVEGEAGIGKTRLLDAWLFRWAAGIDVPFVLAGTHAGGGAVEALAGAVREHVSGLDMDTTIRRRLARTPLLAPALLAVVHGAALPVEGAGSMRDAIRAALVAYVEALEAEAPTVIVVEDLHRATDEGRALFAALAAAARGRRILLVGTFRPDLPEAFLAAVAAGAPTERVKLGRLSPKVLAALLTDALGSERLADELGFGIGAKSDGNPFFVFEVLRALRETGRLVRTGEGSWVRTEAIRRIEIPSSVRDLVRERLAGLAEEDRDLLDVASCAGEDFDPLLVGEALGLERIPVLKRIGRLERERRLLRSVGVRCRFDQASVREAVHEELPELLRREYHAALGNAIEVREAAAGRVPGDAVGETATTALHHFLEGRKPQKALPYLDHALDHANHAGDLEGEVDLALRALATQGLVTQMRRANLLLRAARGLAHLGRRDEQKACADEAIALATAEHDEGVVARGRYELGWFDLHRGALDAAAEHFEAAIEGARRSGNLRTEGGAHGGLGTLLRQRRRFEEALAHHARQSEIAEALGDASARGSAHTQLGNLHWAMNRVPEALAEHELALAAAVERGDVHTESIATGNLGLCELELGHFEAAERRLERQLELARGMGYRRGAAIALGNLAEIARCRGFLARALDFHERHLAAVEEIDYARGRVVGKSGLGTTLLRLGSLDIAETALLEAADAAGAAGVHGLVEDIDVDLAEIALLRGDPATAVERLGETVGSATPWVRVRALSMLARAHLARRDAGAARAALEAAIALARAKDLPREGLWAEVVAATVFGGDLATAREALRTQGPRVPVWTRAELLDRLGERVGGEGLRAEARRIVEHLVTNAPPRYRAAMVAAVPLYAKILGADTRG